MNLYLFIYAFITIPYQVLALIIGILPFNALIELPVINLPIFY